ncbi:hypothetical protein ACLOJK_014557 [Asimina triloba]
MGIPITAKKIHSVDCVSTGSFDGIPIVSERRHASSKSPFTPEDSTGTLLHEVAPQVITIEEEDHALALTSMEEPESLVCPGVLAETFRELSLSKSYVEVFWHSFDMEGWALKILRDLALVLESHIQSRVIWESASIGLQAPRDAECRDSAKLTLCNLLPYVWQELCNLDWWIRFIDKCSPQAEH